MYIITNALAKYPRPLLDYTHREIFVASLLLVYAMTLASESLIEVALEDVELTLELEAYFSKHLIEERDHAQWLLSDLSSAGIVPHKVDWRAAQLAGTQYYLIKHVSADALLGYMAVLECQPAPLAAIEQLEKLYGKRLLRTARYHAEHDAEHGDDLLAFIEANVKTLDIPLIVENIEQTSWLLQTIYHSQEFRRGEQKVSNG